MITKRQLGLIFISLGGAGALGSFAIDLVRTNDFAGIGPTQRLGLIAAAALILVGLTLLPFGNKPA